MEVDSSFARCSSSRNSREGPVTAMSGGGGGGDCGLFELSGAFKAVTTLGGPESLSSHAATFAPSSQSAIVPPLSSVKDWRREATGEVVTGVEETISVRGGGWSVRDSAALASDSGTVEGVAVLSRIVGMGKLSGAFGITQ